MLSRLLDINDRIKRQAGEGSGRRWTDLQVVDWRQFRTGDDQQ
jgi:hypothetical protein